MVVFQSYGGLQSSQYSSKRTQYNTRVGISPERQVAVDALVTHYVCQPLKCVPHHALLVQHHQLVAAVHCAPREVARVVRLLLDADLRGRERREKEQLYHRQFVVADDGNALPRDVGDKQAASR